MNRLLAKTQARRSHVTPAISGLGQLETMNRVAESERVGQQVPPEKPVRLAWLDQRGQIRCAVGRCIDASSKRMHIEVSEQIPLQTRVTLRANTSNIAGSAFVKYVTHYETKFILVLETY